MKRSKPCIPNTFHQWEFNHVGFWQGEAGAVHAKEAIRWLIFDVLHLEREEIPSKLHIETFRSFGLGGMLSIRFQNNISKALHFVYSRANSRQWNRCKRRTPWSHPRPHLSDPVVKSANEQSL